MICDLLNFFKNLFCIYNQGISFRVNFCEKFFVFNKIIDPQIICI